MHKISMIKLYFKLNVNKRLDVFIFCSKNFADFTTEENNFVLVFYGLTKIVYPVIQNEFNTKCPDPVQHKIGMGIYQIYDQQQAKNKDAKNRKKKQIYLTVNQKQQLFSSKGKFIFIYFFIFFILLISIYVFFFYLLVYALIILFLKDVV